MRESLLQDDVCAESSQRSTEFMEGKTHRKLLIQLWLWATLAEVVGDWAGSCGWIGLGVVVMSLGSLLWHLQPHK